MAFALDELDLEPLVERAGFPQLSTLIAEYLQALTRDLARPIVRSEPAVVAELVKRLFPHYLGLHELLNRALLDKRGGTAGLRNFTRAGLHASSGKGVAVA